MQIVDAGIQENRSEQTFGDHPSRAILERYFARVFSRNAVRAVLASRSARTARWGVVQPVGHLTVNEDGEGSNPSAPAKLTVFLFFCLRGVSRAARRRQ